MISSEMHIFLDHPRSTSNDDSDEIPDYEAILAGNEEDSEK